MSKVVVCVVVTECMGGMSTWVSMGMRFSVAWETKVSIVSKTMLSSVTWETMVSAMSETVLKSMSMEAKVCVVKTMSEVIMVKSMSITVIETVWCSMWEAVVETMSIMSKTMIETMSIVPKTVIETMSIVPKTVIETMSIVAEMVTPSISVVTVSVVVSISVVHWSSGVASWVVVLFIITVGAESMFVSSDFRWDVIDVLWETMVIMSHMVVLAMSVHSNVSMVIDMIVVAWGMRSFIEVWCSVVSIAEGIVVSPSEGIRVTVV